MNSLSDIGTRTFVQVIEVWRAEGDRLVLGQGAYGALDAFAAVSAETSFGRGEGLPGRAGAEARPVVLKVLDASAFHRAEAAAEAGLTTAVAIPLFDAGALKSVVTLLCGGDTATMGAIEVWAERDGELALEDGYYGAAEDFEWVSQHTRFGPGQGLPGGAWAARTPILMRELGAGYFIRAESAARAGLQAGIALPVPAPSGRTFILTLLSAPATPIARRFEIWDARAARTGGHGGAELIDGLCLRDGPLWSDEDAPRIAAWQGPLGRALGSGLPVLIAGKPDIAQGYDMLLALPIHQSGELSHLVALYC